jgi:transposase-like protein
MGTKRQRRTFNAEFKARVVLEVLTGQKTAAQVCREQQLKPDLLSRWKAEFVTHASSVFSGDEREQEAERRIAELERLVGRLALELEVAKKAALLSGGSRNGR